MENNQEIMELIAYAGDARSKFLESIRYAKDDKFSRAHEIFCQGEISLNLASSLNARIFEHNHQSTVSLFVVHSQDYLMQASTLKELALIMIGYMKDHSHD